MKVDSAGSARAELFATLVSADSVSHQTSPASAVCFRSLSAYVYARVLMRMPLCVCCVLVVTEGGNRGMEVDRAGSARAELFSTFVSADSVSNQTSPASAVCFRSDSACVCARGLLACPCVCARVCVCVYVCCVHVAQREGTEG